MVVSSCLSARGGQRRIGGSTYPGETSRLPSLQPSPLRRCPLLARRRPSFCDTSLPLVPPVHSGDSRDVKEKNNAGPACLGFSHGLAKRGSARLGSGKARLERPFLETAAFVLVFAWNAGF